MYSYQSTTDSQSDSIQRKLAYKIKKAISLKRQPKRAKVQRNQKIQNNEDKIQIQDPFPQAKNFSHEVRSYARDIMTYIESDESNSIVKQNYMNFQTDINFEMRQILVGWLIEVTSGFNLRMETLHLAVLLVDKYCELKNILKRRYQVLGGACLYIAAKYEEIVTPRLKRYLQISDGAYTASQLLAMESEVLLTLKFQIRQKSTLTYFEIKSKEYNVSKSVLDLGYFLLELCLIEFECCSKKPTLLSLAVLYTAMRLRKKTCLKVKQFAWQNKLDEESFFDCVEYVEKLFNIRHELRFYCVRKRYSILLAVSEQLK